MKYYPVLFVLVSLIVVGSLFVVIQYVLIQSNGTSVAAPAIPREPQQLGQGPALMFVVMGDSTSIGQGTEYEDSYAVAAANHVAKQHRVTFVNTGISGARAATVVSQQLEKAVSYKPDVVLLAVGANDATHFTSTKMLQGALETTIVTLRQANPAVKIVITGSPAMDSVDRFPWGSKQLMGLRTRQVNQAFTPLITKYHLILAPIAQETRAAFLADPTLTAVDNFHPNARGYALWIPVVNRALDRALQ